MKLSVIIPAYNTAKYLRECVGSVKVVDEVEIILIDDGSTDGETAALCDELAAVVPCAKVIHTENRGLGAARNLGLRLAQGDYVLFLDSDDLLADGATETLLKATEHGADVIAFGFSVRNGDIDTLHKTEIKMPNGIFSVSSEPEYLLSLPSAWSRAWKRTFLQGSGIEFPSRLRYEDLATVPALLATAETIYPIHDALYIYRLRCDSIMSDSDPTKNLEIITAFDTLLLNFDCLGLTDRFKRELERLAVDHILLAASVRVLSGGGKAARRTAESFTDYVRCRFPQFNDNPYLCKLNVRQKLLLSLLVKCHFRLAQLCTKAYKRLH